MNRRSLIHDLEIDVVLHSRSTLTQAARQFEIDLIDAKPIRLESLNWRTIAGQVLDSLLRPWI
jgi:phosphatidylserine/phosphatidylglycerophosphate/cardiolipin synthase-like enzyme